jgi:hypothetical protein
MAVSVKKITIGAIALAGIYWLLGRANKARNIPNNIYVQSNLVDVNLGLLQSTWKLGINIRNITGFNLSIRNVFSKVFINTSDGKRIEVGVTNLTPRIDMPNGGESNSTAELRVSNISVGVNLMKTTSIEVVTWYDFAGQQLNYPSSIDVKSISGPILAKLGISKGVSGLI